MRNLKTATIGVAAGALLVFGGFGIANAQNETSQRIDIGTVTSDLELSDATARDLAPLVDRLNALFERRQEHRREADDIQQELVATYDEIAKILSASQLREFHWYLRQEAVGGGSGIGRGAGGYMSGVPRGGTGNRRPALRGGRGYCGLDMQIPGRPGYSSQRMRMRGIRGGAIWNRMPNSLLEDNTPNN